MSIIKRGDDFFQAGTYTGNGSTQTISGLRFQPDFVWIKGRSGATDHALYDAVRGATKQLESNQTGAESTESTGLTAFTSDGFTLGSLAQVNTNAATYAYWAWKANGAGVTNTDGTITSTVSVNTTSGFSIVTYVGDGVGSGTVGHGLGVTPNYVILKNKSATSDWYLFYGTNTFLRFNTTAAGAASTFNKNSSTFQSWAGNTNTWLAYCFAEVPGYSAFGSYTGNGNNDGPFVYTGFRPAFVLTKRTNSTSNWVIQDNKRQTYNPSDAWLRPNTSDAEGTTSPDLDLDFTSNGFKIRNNGTDNNISGSTYIYMAFAENPFAYALAR